MKNEEYDLWAAKTLPELIELLRILQANIGDEYRASDDPNDDTPAMQITISTNDNLTHWSYQTGDNSYTGGCYCDRYWGVGALYRDGDCAKLADSLLNDLSEQIEFK